MRAVLMQKAKRNSFGLLPLGGRIGALSERGWLSVLREDSECHYLEPSAPRLVFTTSPIKCVYREELSHNYRDLMSLILFLIVLVKRS